MFGNIEDFTLKFFLENTYPTNDDTDAIKNLLKYIELSLKDKINLSDENVKKFIESFTRHVRVISTLCTGHVDMDTCEISAIEQISDSIHAELNELLSKESDVLMLNGNYFLNLYTLPDAVKFYNFLIVNNKITTSISRKGLEKLYHECNMSSLFSHVLFDLSWLNVLRVYNTKIVYFNQTPPFRF